MDARPLGKKSSSKQGLLVEIVGLLDLDLWVQPAGGADLNGREAELIARQIDIDEGRSFGSSGFHGRLGVGQREIEENLWRAIRHGMDGEMIDFRDRRLVPTRVVLEDLVEWTEPARGTLGVDVDLPEQNGAQRAYARFAEGAPIEEIYRRAVEETRKTYAPEGAVSGR